MREIMMSLNKNEATILLAAILDYHAPEALQGIKASLVAEIQADLRDRLKWLLDDEITKHQIDEYERCQL